MRYLSMLASCVLLCGTLAGCVRDNVDVDDSDDELYELAADEYGFGVTISLDKLSSGSSRAALGDLGTNGLKDLEEYVNTDNLYILFFNLDGIFLFQINKPVAIPIGQSALGNDNQWFIRIPVKDINENLIHYIEENPFKIAVLANWTFDADINTGGTWDAFEFHEPVDGGGNLVYDSDGKLKGDHISLLSHAQLDTSYEDPDKYRLGYDHLVYRTETGPHMGPYTNWVDSYHRSIEVADDDIRKYFDVKENVYQNPDSKYTDANGRQTAINHFKIKYNNLWQIWNFGGDDNKEFIFEMQNDQVKKDWLDINKQAKEKFLKEYDQTTSGAMLKWSMNKYPELEITKSGTELNVEIPEKETDEDEATYQKRVAEAKSKFNGIVFNKENLSWDDNAGGEPLNLNSPDRPYLHFMAYADGYVRVSYKAQGGAKLFVHVRRNNTPENNSNYKDANKSNRKVLNEDGFAISSDGKIAVSSVSYDPENVYIYMVKDPAYQPGPDELEVEPSVTIYGVEYIESRHLYDVDRNAILPSKDYPIPMYGVQDFDPIGEYWEPGILFNLSQFNNSKKTDKNYHYRTVSLLRSLSRVEVKLLKSAYPKKPSHVFMRSMNRSARITPVDFFTPTDIVWNGFSLSRADDGNRRKNYEDFGNYMEAQILEETPGYVKEVQNIRDFGPIYIGTGQNIGQSDEEIMAEFRRTTAWAFGIWEPQWGWNWNRNNVEESDDPIEDTDDNRSVKYFDTYVPGPSNRRNHTGQTIPPYPRIFHTRISRSDYARFTEVEDPNYWHYIMYIPEKNITDADNPGNVADRPKVIHVEIRFNGGFPEYDENGNPSTKDPDNVVNNFDDNGAYRLYFTENTRDPNYDTSNRENWDNYEYNWSSVSKHWPIMRNFIYVFTVNGGVDNQADATLEVMSPDKREAFWQFD